MAGMMTSDKNRGAAGIDNRNDDDGFWSFRKFKGKRRTGAPTGGRGWRRALRANEKIAVSKEIRDSTSEV